MSRHTTGSLRQGATLSQNVFCDPVLVLLAFRAYNHGLKGPQKPKTDCENELLRSYLSPPVFIVRSGTVWDPVSRWLPRQHLPTTLVSTLTVVFALLLKDQQVGVGGHSTKRHNNPRKDIPQPHSLSPLYYAQLLPLFSFFVTLAPDMRLAQTLDLMSTGTY